jgi:hypothetical protein
MFLRLTRGHVDPAHADELVRAMPGVVAAIRQLPGMIGIQVGLDRGTGRSVSLITFERLEDARFSRDQLGAGLDPLYALGWTAEEPEIFEAIP